MFDGRIAPNTGHLYNGARITTCPEYGKDKWAYIGGDLPAEPPCFSCQTPEYFERKRQAENATPDSADAVPTPGRSPERPDAQVVPSTSGQPVGLFTPADDCSEPLHSGRPS